MTSWQAAIAALVFSVTGVALFIPGEARDRLATSRSLASLGTRAPPWKFSPLVSAAPVTGLDGKPMPAPFLGGFDVPRPQLVDINGDGHLELFLQERSGEIMEFQHVGDQWIWRTNRYQDLDVGEWFRFVDVDGDGRIDLLGEMQTGYIRMWKNVGTKSAARFVAFGDTIRDVDGRAILADRQNILNAVDIDCNGKLDLFIGRVQGIVDRFEQEGNSPDGTPRFRLIEEGWQGIQVLGPEATGASLQRTDTTGEGPGGLSPAGSSRHGANTLTFADIDGKGTLDLFWGDFFEPGLLRFPNTGTCAQPNLQEPREQFPAGHPVYTSGYNAPTFGDVDGDGNPDLVMGVIGGAYQPRTTAVDNLYLIQQAPKGTWTVRTKRLIPTIDVGSEAMPVLADLHGEGKLDLLIGNKISPNDETTGVGHVVREYRHQDGAGVRRARHVCRSGESSTTRPLLSISTVTASPTLSSEPGAIGLHGTATPAPTRCRHGRWPTARWSPSPAAAIPRQLSATSTATDYPTWLLVRPPAGSMSTGTPAPGRRRSSSLSATIFRISRSGAGARLCWSTWTAMASSIC